MPKSKRVRNKPLSQTDKKGNDLKIQVIDAIRTAVDKYNSAYVFTFENMRTNHFKNVRLEFRDSRFFLGKNKVMKVALGREATDEYAENIHLLSGYISGNTGLLFTNKDRKEVEKFFANLAVKDFARSGYMSTDQFCISPGPQPQFAGSMIESLRKLGLPVKLNKGVIEVTEFYTVCKKGEILTPEQAKILVHYEKKIAQFSIKLASHWSGGQFSNY